MIDILKNPWHWSVAGALIGLAVPVLLILGNKKFGISSALRDICAMCIPANIPFFKYDWKKEKWNLLFILGIVIGGFIANTVLKDPNPMLIANKTHDTLAQYGITDFSGLMPEDVFSWKYLLSLKGFIFFIVGGFLVGFGTRYAGGCTSGHAIMGLSDLQLPSLIATCSFMAGGFFCANILMPLIFKLF